jgi:hypothetical protein
MVVDASGLRFTDSHTVHRGQPVAMMGLKLDFLTSGCHYDLKRRIGMAPPPMVRILTDPMDRREPEKPPVLTEEVRAGAKDGGE